ncbi:unnamed protein product [Discosporangium mesarthrocarpum]
MDKQTGKSKGYGFVTFKNMDSTYAAIETPEKIIDGRTSLCNLAAVRSTQPLPSQKMGGFAQSGTGFGMGMGGAGGGGGGGGGEDITMRKIFIRGLAWDTTVETLRNVFSSFGELDDAIVTMDRQTGKSKGYGFVTFRQATCAAAAVAEAEKQIDGRLTHCNIAASGSNRNKPFFGGQQTGQQWGVGGFQTPGAMCHSAGQWGGQQGYGGQWGQYGSQGYGAGQGGFNGAAHGMYGAQVSNRRYKCPLCLKPNWLKTLHTFPEVYLKPASRLLSPTGSCFGAECALHAELWVESRCISFVCC